MCPAPQIHNGRVTAPKPRYTYRDSVTFKCRRGFTLRGHATSQCRGDRTWHPPVPVCEQGKNQHRGLSGSHIPPRFSCPLTKAKVGFMFPVCSDYFNEKAGIFPFIYASLHTQEMSQGLGNAVSIGTICTFSHCLLQSITHILFTPWK